MLRHVVFFKFKSDIPQIERERAISELKALPEKIDLIREFEVGADILHLPRSWDLVLIAAYDDKDALQVYSHHPAHVPVVQLMQSLCESIGSVDFDV